MKFLERLQIRWISRALGAVACFALFARLLEFGLAEAMAGLVYAYGEIARILFGWITPLVARFFDLTWPRELDDLLLFYSLILTAAARFAVSVPAIVESYERRSIDDIIGPAEIFGGPAFFALFLLAGINLVTPVELNGYTISAADVWVAENILGSREAISASAAVVMPWVSMPFRAAFLVTAFFLVALFVFFAGSIGGAPRTAAARQKAVAVSQGSIFGTGATIAFGLLAFCAGVLYELLFVLGGFGLLLAVNAGLEAL